MKRLLCLTGTFMLMYSILIAQPTLTATGINFEIGETYYFIDISYVSPGNPGANQTWDLSSATITSQKLTTVVAPSSTVNGGDFPYSNIACSNFSGVMYFKTSATAFQNYGISSTSSIIAYSDPEDLLRYPFNYNDTYSDTWATQFLSGGYNFYRKGTTTLTADGYGTLITPGGTYTNTMRVHLVQVYQDSVSIQGTQSIITYTNDEYVWFKEGIHNQLAIMYSLTSSSGGPYTGGNYISVITEIDDISDFTSSINLFPNPASDKIALDITLAKNQKVDICLFNYLGQQIEINKVIDGVEGVNATQLDVSSLSNGIYFVQIVLDGNIASYKRFVISK